VSPGVWLQIAKKAADAPSVSYAEAVEAALCFGWIDGQLKPCDAGSWLRRFSPRRPRGAWSKKNTEHAERLIRSGRMAPAGLAEVEAARKDGRWAAAYHPPSVATVPADFLRALRRDKKALSFFKALNRANLYSISYRLQTAKTPETRARRTQKILAMLARGEKFH